mgnify:CR=1 FL=1
MVKRQKQLSLQRAYFNEGFNSSLQEVLERSFGKLANAKDRIIDLDLISKQVFVSLESNNDDGVFLRVFDYEEGATGVINLDTTDTARAIEEFSHPQAKNFLKDQAIFLIVDNAVLACNAGNKMGTYGGSMLRMAQGAQVVGSEVKIRIADIPDRNVLERIRRVGVKKVHFSVTTFMENLHFGKDQSAGSRVMRMIFGESETSSDKIRRRANVVGHMQLSRGRFDAEEGPIDQWLTEIGAELIEASAPDSFRLELEDESKISESMMKKSKTVHLTKTANSFSYHNAKVELRNYLSELRNEASAVLP